MLTIILQDMHHFPLLISSSLLICNLPPDENVCSRADTLLTIDQTLVCARVLFIQQQTYSIGLPYTEYKWTTWKQPLKVQQ